MKSTTAELKHWRVDVSFAAYVEAYSENGAKAQTLTKLSKIRTKKFRTTRAKIEAMLA